MQAFWNPYCIIVSIAFKHIIKILDHFLYHDQCGSYFMVDQENLQEPQIHNKEREGEHSSGHGDVLNCMTNNQSED